MDVTVKDDWPLRYFEDELGHLRACLRAPPLAPSPKQVMGATRGLQYQTFLQGCMFVPNSLPDVVISHAYPCRNSLSSG